MRLPRVLPLGDAAVTVELGDGIDALTNARVRGLDRDLARAPCEGLREAVPTHRSLLVLYDPGVTRFSALARELLVRAERAVPAPPSGRLLEIPTLYGGDAGPDLAALARLHSLPQERVVGLHASGEYTAFMLGFTPGFAYLGLLPETLETPRRETPRVRVPAGTVAIAGRQTAVYPTASPGGWQLIGRTALRLFDPFREEPALIAPGDRVRFRPIPELREIGSRPAARQPRSGAVVEVVEPGLLTSVQDAGRVGSRRLGVSGSGAMDTAALAAANRALGNPEGAAGLECTIAGPTLRFLAAVRFAIAGGDLGAQLERADLGSWPVPSGAAVLARPGNLLRFTGRRAGCRAVIALAGGIDVPAVLGARATDLVAGFGGHEGRALAAGDRVAVARHEAAQDRSIAPLAYAQRVTARVVLGPQADQLQPGAIALFLSSPWRVGSTSDRVGCRLEGPRLRHRGAAEIVSDGMVPGSIQVPPDGRPIVMMVDGPTTGGYPKIATVLTADLPALAQLVPGEGELRFEAVPPEDL